MWYLSLIYFRLSMIIFRSIHVTENNIISPFYDWIIFHCMCAYIHIYIYIYIFPHLCPSSFDGACPALEVLNAPLLQKPTTSERQQIQEMWIQGNLCQRPNGSTARDLSSETAVGGDRTELWQGLSWPFCSGPIRWVRVIHPFQGQARH